MPPRPNQPAHNHIRQLFARQPRTRQQANQTLQSTRDPLQSNPSLKQAEHVLIGHKQKPNQPHR